MASALTSFSSLLKDIALMLDLIEFDHIVANAWLRIFGFCKHACLGLCAHHCAMGHAPFVITNFLQSSFLGGQYFCMKIGVKGMERWLSS